MLQITIGSTYLAAALAKIFSRASLESLFVQLGMSSGVSRRLSDATPFMEATVAGALLLSRGLLPGIASVLLSAGFIATLTILLRRRLGVSCRCFGALDHGPVSYATLCRAVGLGLASLTVVAAGLAQHDPAISVNHFGRTEFILGTILALTYIHVFAIIDRILVIRRYRRSESSAGPMTVLLPPEMSMR